MIATGDEIHAAFEHLIGGLGGQTEAARGILAVGDASVNMILLSKQ
jgi:hypothetical protein